MVNATALQAAKAGYGADVAALAPNTAWIAALAQSLPSPLDTPMAPATWPFTTIGSPPAWGKSPIRTGARFFLGIQQEERTR